MPSARSSSAQLDILNNSFPLPRKIICVNDYARTTFKQSMRIMKSKIFATENLGGQEFIHEIDCVEEIGA
jgi:hypothetical protein